MTITKLKAKNFRNYEYMELPMSPKGAIFLGLNGEGKTNLIEAIHTLSLGHSHRTSRDQEMILWGEKYFYLKAEGIKKEGRFISEVLVGDKGKKVKINHQQAKKVSELMGHCNTVIFSPEDLYLTKGPESIRRKYMNKELSQVDSLYKNHLLKYHRILKRRNHYLRYHKERFDEDVLMSLTEQLTEEAGFLIDQRRRFTEEISAIAEEIYGTFTQNQEKLTITYEPKVASKDELYEKLKKAREEELRRGTTLYGPHLDDLRVKVKDYDLRRFGSQGQQRSGALAMKIAEIRYIEHKTKDKPLLLLDDVMSELDERRRSFLFDTIEDIQLFLTTTHMEEEWAKKTIDIPYYTVKQGTLRAHRKEYQHGFK